MSLIVLTLEWSSESALEPVVFVGDDETTLRREAARFTAACLADGDLSEVYPGEWAAKGNALEPDYNDPDSVRAWQSALWEWTTELNVTIYRAPGEGAHEAVTYFDCRTPDSAPERSDPRTHDHDAYPSEQKCGDM